MIHRENGRKLWKSEAGGGLRASVLVRLGQGGVRFLLAAVLSGVELPGGYAPLGVAFVGACGPGTDGACALLGSLLGALCARGVSQGLREMAAGVLVFSVAFAFYDVRLCAKSWFMPAVTAGAVGVTGLVTLTSRAWTAGGGAWFAAAVLLAGSAVYFDRIALTAPEPAGGEELSHRQRVCLLLFGGTLLMSLAQVTVLDGLSVGRGLAMLAVLWAGGLGGVGPGAAVGVGAGVAMELAGGDGLYPVAYGFAGLLTGMLKNQGRLFACLAFAAANASMALWMWERSSGCVELLYEGFVASVLFLCLPEKLYRRPGVSLTGGDGGSAARRQAYVRQRLEATAGAFRSVCESLRGSFLPGRETGEESPFHIFDRAAQRVCLRCQRREECWQKDYQATAGALNDGLEAMLERGKGLAGDFPGWFTARCLRFPQFLEAANEELTALLYRRRYQVRLQRSRAAVCQQYGELARALEEAALELGREMTAEPVRERRLGRWLAGRQIEGEWAVFYDEHRRLRAEIVTREGESLADEASRAELSRLFGVPLRRAALKRERGRARVIYTQAEPLAAVAGVAAKKRDGQLVSGDAGSWFKGEDGVLWLLLCDGMGSGEQANRESSLAVRLLEAFLRAGVAPEDALRTLNSALALRGEAEGGFTTVDLCRVDLFTGAGSVYKLGAAPTYIKKKDTVLRVTGTTLPAGLTAQERVEADVTPFRLEVGDCLVLLTDGITDGEEDEWLRQALREFDGASPRALARALLERADGEQAADDRTVMVVRLSKRDAAAPAEGETIENRAGS